MRPIEYRTWDGEKMWFVQGLRFDEGTDYAGKVFVNICGARFGIADDHFHDGFPKLMQYTGLLDRKKIKTFEDDIVVGKWPYATKCIVTWIEKRGGFMLRTIDGLNGGSAYDREGYKLNSGKFEIIGNRWENPELLNE